MGVKGLWHLLEPAARPMDLESLEGKVGRWPLRAASALDRRERSRGGEEETAEKRRKRNELAIWKKGRPRMAVRGRVCVR